MEGWKKFMDSLERFMVEVYMREACIALSSLVYEWFGGTLEYRVLRALLYRPLTLKELSEALGERRGSIKAFNGYAGRLRRVVEGLEARGLIEARRAGRAKLYSIVGGTRGRLIRELIGLSPTEAGVDHRPDLP